MKYEKDRKIFGIDEFKIQKIARIMIIPAIVLILIIVILIINGQSKKNKETTAAVISAEDVLLTNAQESEGNNEEYFHNFDSYGLQKDAVPEIGELIAKYQRAKVTGDANLLYEVFGRSDDEGKEEMQEKLSSEAEVYESYENTTVYTTAGLDEGTYLAYVAADVKFKGIDTPAPMLIWAYVVPADDGHLYIKEPSDLTEDEKLLLDKISASEDVKLLDSDMRSRLAQAVVSDVQLAALYEVWADPGVLANESNEAGVSEATPADEVVISE